MARRVQEREIISVARHQRLFRDFIAAYLDDPAESGQLQAELMAASFVVARAAGCQRVERL